MEDMQSRIKCCATMALALIAAGMLNLYSSVCEEMVKAEAPVSPAVESIATVAAMTAKQEGAHPLAAVPADEDKPAWTTLRCQVYHYCECQACTGKHEGSAAYGVTATGTRVHEGRTVAVDPDVIPLGSEVWINGHVYTAEDTGVHGRAVDIYVPDHAQARQMGTYETLVMWR